jgi:hypothetical protein
MKTYVLLMVAGAIWLMAGLALTAQTTNTAPADTAVTGGGLAKPLSDLPFLGTDPVLTLGGDYVNTPREDYEMLGKWTSPLSLEEMHGAIAQVGFGKADKRGQWQIVYKRKLMTMDPSWEALADANRGLTLSDSRTEVLKASYSVRDWWQLGIAGFSENRFGADTDLLPLGLDGGQSLGFQIDSSLKF